MIPEVTDFEILLAEDNSADVILVREAFAEHQLHCNLHVVKDGAEAIAFIESLDRDPKEPRLDLVLLDMHLPKRDGDEVLESVRSSAHYAQTPVIIMSGSDSPADREKAARYPALHYFRKPASLAEFLQLGAIARSILTARPRLPDNRKEDSAA
jgi:CheY-like chemotaxis protein